MRCVSIWRCALAAAALAIVSTSSSFAAHAEGRVAPVTDNDQARGGRVYLAQADIGAAPRSIIVQPDAPAAADAIGAPPRNIAVEPDASAAAAARAIFYEEDETNPNGKRTAAVATWRSELVSRDGQASETVIIAEINVPDKGMTISLSFQPHADPSLPASSVVEIKFKLPPNSTDDIGNVPGVVLKVAEERRGTPLIGRPVKVASGVFLIGLSAVEAERQSNEQLLRERAWFDIAIVFASGKRAILALEKGAAGERAFNTAFAARQPNTNR